MPGPEDALRLLVQHELSFAQFRKAFGLQYNADIPPFLILGKYYRPDVSFTRALGLIPEHHEKMRAWLKIRIARHSANPELMVAMKQLIDAERVAQSMRTL